MAVNRSVVADPDKVANVWHLATAEPERLETSAAGEAVNDFLDPPDTSQIHGIACHADWRFAARAGAVRRRYEGATRAPSTIRDMSSSVRNGACALTA